MITSSLAKKTVKVISQKIEMDWIHPYKNTNTKSSIGSGFFIDNQGHILTCSHVIENSKKVFIEIPFEGDQKIEVTVIGLCPELDIALLKTIDYINKEYYELHSREEIYTIKPGCEVYAIGFPLGQDNLKFTKGIISGRQKSLIQTDTPINPGNSGGPLLLDNKVIGINTSIIMFTNNIGYATPISFYYIIQKELFNNNSKLIKIPSLGLTFQNSNQALIDMNRCKCQTGILVKDIFKGSPISKTGIKEGDIICSVNGIKVDNFGLFDFLWFNEKMKLDDILRTIKTGEKIEIQFWRGQKLFIKNFSFNLFSLEIEKKFPMYEINKVDYEVLGGLIVMELTSNHLEIIMDDIEKEFSRNNNIHKKYTNILKYISPENKKEKKLIITHIFPNSHLQNFEILSEYDIIDEINNKKCNSLEQFRKNIKKVKKIGSQKFLKIKTEINNTIVLNINELLKEEKNFADTYKYNISPLYKYLIKESKTKKKTKVFNKKTKKN